LIKPDDCMSSEADPQVLKMEFPTAPGFSTGNSISIFGAALVEADAACCRAHRGASSADECSFPA